MTQAMRELRDIAAGLLLPDLSGQTLEECIEAPCETMRRRPAPRSISPVRSSPVDCPKQVKTCVCRFIQEGLANSFRHAGGKGQRVHVDGATDFIRVIVADSGPGMPSTFSARTDRTLA